MSVKLFENGTIITWDDSVNDFKVLRQSSLLVEGNRVTAIWEGDAKPANLSLHDERISIEGKILSPGLVDSHRHGWQSLFRTLAANIHLGNYMDIVGPFGKPMEHVTSDELYYSTLESMYESIESGTTTVVENPHHNWDEQSVLAGWNASLDSGARIHWAYHIGQGRDPAYDFNAQIEVFKKIHAADNWRNTIVDLGLNWENFGGGTPEEVSTVVNLVKELNVSAVHANHVGYPLLDGPGNNPTVLRDVGLLNSSIPVFVVHVTNVTAEDIALLREHNQYAIITPESEMQHGHDHISSHTFLDQAALGVDNNVFYGSSMVSQGRLWMQATRRRMFAEAHSINRVRNTTGITVNQAFHLITRSGGLALKRPDIGVIRVGALADLVVFDGESAGMLGWSDPIAAIVSHSQVGDVRHVLVNGEWRKFDGQLLPTKSGLSWASVKKEFLKSTVRLSAIWATFPPVVLIENGWRTGAEYIHLPQVNVTREQFAGQIPS